MTIRMRLGQLEVVNGFELQRLLQPGRLVSLSVMVILLDLKSSPSPSYTRAAAPRSHTWSLSNLEVDHGLHEDAAEGAVDRRAHLQRAAITLRCLNNLKRTNDPWNNSDGERADLPIIASLIEGAFVRMSVRCARLLSVNVYQCTTVRARRLVCCA